MQVAIFGKDYKKNVGMDVVLKKRVFLHGLSLPVSAALDDRNVAGF